MTKFKILAALLAMTAPTAVFAAGTACCPDMTCCSQGADCCDQGMMAKGDGDSMAGMNHR